MADVPVSEAQEQQYRTFLAREEVRLPCCMACGYVRLPGQWLCPKCLSTDWEWKQLDGVGAIETFVWYMQSVHQDFTDVPYNVAIVQFDGGPRVISNIVDCGFGDVAVGQKVTAAFRRRGDKPILCFFLRNG